jgi:hypothetical protein
VSTLSSAEKRAMKSARVAAVEPVAKTPRNTPLTMILPSGVTATA